MTSANDDRHISHDKHMYINLPLEAIASQNRTEGFPQTSIFILSKFDEEHSNWMKAL